MRVALIGNSGYWGQKIGRVLQERGISTENFGRSNIEHLNDADADAAIIATPPNTHYEIAMKAMRIGMDVFLEKPVSNKLYHAVKLKEKAVKEGIVLFIDSTFLFSKSFEYLNGLRQRLIGYQSLRTSPPMPQAQINAAWDMLWHDMAILDGLGSLESGKGQVDGSVACAGLTLPTGGTAFMFASRMWPHKIRTVTLHFNKGSYIWTLDGLQSYDGTPLVVEDEETLNRAVAAFERRCRNREIYGLTDGDHGIAVTQAIERTFRGQIDDGQYSREYELCVASAVPSV